MEPDTVAGPAVPTPRRSPQPGFDAFLEENYRYFLKVLMAVGATVEDAQDAVQDVIEKMLEKDTWDSLTANPRAWIRKALLHTYYDQQNRRRLRGELERNLPWMPGSYTFDGPNAWEDWQWVKQQLSRLPPTQRTVVELILSEMGPSEIADLLGKTPATIRQNLAHARKRLRANLGDDYQTDRATRRKEDTL